MANSGRLTCANALWDPRLAQSSAYSLQGLGASDCKRRLGRDSELLNGNLWLGPSINT
jgi:hypothetical protein